MLKLVSLVAHKKT